MSLSSRILFAGSMLACAALCAWAGVSFGGPAAPVMWGLAGMCAVIAAVVWMIKPPKELENPRVEGTPEPTFRLRRSEPGFKGEIWHLVLGHSKCTLIRPDGSRATTFARKWTDHAIKLPDMVSGEMIRIVTEDWASPDQESWLSHNLANAARNLLPHAGLDAGFYYFSPSKEVVAEIEAYKRQTPN